MHCCTSDDEALGVGGTLIKHSKNSSEVFVVILSRGEEAKVNKQDINPQRLNNAKNGAS